MPRFSILLWGTLALAMTPTSTATVVSAPAAFVDVKTTHAVTASLAFALLMPIGAILIRTLRHRSALMLHASLMIFAWVLSAVSLATGIYMAFYIQMLDTPHSIIGFVVIVGCMLQPATGWWHHVLYMNRANGNGVGALKRTYKVTHSHVWWGRALITLGIINGGLGFELSRQLYAIGTPLGAEIGYAVGAGVIWAVWMSVCFEVYRKNKRRSDAGRTEKAIDLQVKSGEETPQLEETKDIQTSFLF